MESFLSAICLDYRKMEEKKIGYKWQKGYWKNMPTGFCGLMAVGFR